MPPLDTDRVHDTPKTISFIASLEGQNVLLGAIASGFGHKEVGPLVDNMRRFVSDWSAERWSILRSKILTGQIDVIGGNFEQKGALSMLASTLLDTCTPRGRAFEIGKILFRILDSDVNSLDAWLRDVPPRLGPMGCDRERLVLYIVGRLPN